MALDNADTNLLNVLSQLVSSMTTWQATINGSGYDYTQMQPLLDAAARNFQATVDSYRQAKAFNAAVGQG